MLSMNRGRGGGAFRGPSREAVPSRFIYIYNIRDKDSLFPALVLSMIIPLRALWVSSASFLNRGRS